MEIINKQVEEYLRYCEKVRKMTETTMGCKRNVLGRFIKETGIHRLEDLTNDMFNEFIMNEMERGISARSANMYVAVVVAMVRYYREMGMKVPINLALVRKMKEGEIRRKFFTAEEILEVINMADLESELMIRIMFETGMRIAEVTRLRVSDFNGRRVRFIGKGRKPREVYITDKTLRLLLRFISKNEVRDYLWGDYKYGGNGKAPTVNTVRNRLKRAFLKAGFSDFYPHALRHSFATDLQRRGATISEIKEMIGHSSISTTERYLHGFEGRMRELFDKYR